MKAESSHQEGNVNSRRGKKPKRFLEKNDALSLAAAIVDAQEKVTETKVERHHKAEPDHPKEPATDRKKPSSNSKAKLKATKAILSSERIKAKKERSKLRKEQYKNAKKESHGANASAITTSNKPDKPARKTVSFA